MPSSKVGPRLPWKMTSGRFCTSLRVHRRRCGKIPRCCLRLTRCFFFVPVIMTHIAIYRNISYTVYIYMKNIIYNNWIIVHIRCVYIYMYSLNIHTHCKSLFMLGGPPIRRKTAPEDWSQPPPSECDAFTSMCGGWCGGRVTINGA